VLVAKCVWQYSVLVGFFPETPPTHETWALSHSPVGNRSGQFRPWLIVQSFMSRERTDLMVFPSNMGQIFFFLILRTVRHTSDRAVMSPDSHVNLLLITHSYFWRWGNTIYKTILYLWKACLHCWLYESHDNIGSIHSPYNFRIFANTFLDDSEGAPICE
jgi:hypothetical protein